MVSGSRFLLGGVPGLLPVRRTPVDDISSRSPVRPDAGKRSEERSDHGPRGSGGETEESVEVTVVEPKVVEDEVVREEEEARLATPELRDVKDESETPEDPVFKTEEEPLDPEKSVVQSTEESGVDLPCHENRLHPSTRQEGGSRRNL